MASPFIWHELNTTDLAAAADFYGAVVGWATRAHEGGSGYRIFTTGGRDDAGLMVLADAARTAGPHWCCYLQVASADEEAAGITASGGTIQAGPLDIPTVGRFAMAADPQGAAYMILAPLPREGAPVPPPAGTPGHVAWHELHTSDWESAFAFYARYGWEKHNAMDMGAMGTYQIFGAGGVDLGGMMNSPMKPQWLPYVAVADIDAAKTAIDAKGGRILQGPTAIPGGGFIIHGVDPQGATFAITGPRGG